MRFSKSVAAAELDVVYRGGGGSWRFAASSVPCAGVCGLNQGGGRVQSTCSPGQGGGCGTC